ncbi:MULTISPECIES: restriction endonuclease subunit S [Stutzerimonas stutzeri subgroup]|nr:MULTISPECIES: restriction endonuclease subunit S [Stutzerimonas stutzeri subgroup]MCQ2039429.1 restriction endonuclease subunit S [Stutzerimonas kunmingensis]
MSGSKKRPLVPKLRFPEFQAEEGWGTEFGNMIFDQISNKDHNSDLPVLAITQEQGAIPRDMIGYHVSVTDKSLESYKVVEVGDFIISLRSFQGGVEFSRYRGICSPAYVILRLRNEHSEDYFRHYLKTDRFIAKMTKNLEGLRDGKMISYKQFSELELSVPSPEEQKKIADCLSSLDDLIAAENQKLEKLQTHRAVLMQQILPREREAAPRLRFPEFRKRGPWKNKTLSEIATIRSGSTPSRAEPAFYSGGTIPWVKTTDLNNGFIVRTEEYVTSAAKVKVNPVGSVLVAMYGGFKQIGRTGYLTMPAATNQAISVLNADENEVLPIYLLTWMNARVGDWKRIASSSRKDPNITGTDVANFPITYPDKDEQQKIADTVTSVNRGIEAQIQKITFLTAHKTGLLQQLFPAMGEVPA